MTGELADTVLLVCTNTNESWVRKLTGHGTVVIDGGRVDIPHEVQFDDFGAWIRAHPWGISLVPISPWVGWRACQAPSSGCSYVRHDHDVRPSLSHQETEQEPMLMSREATISGSHPSTPKFPRITLSSEKRSSWSKTWER